MQAARHSYAHAQYICWLHSMDSDNPWMELRKAWIHASRGQSIDCSTNSARASAIAQTPECAIIARALSCTHVASNAAIASSGDQLTATLSKSDDHG